MAKQLKYGQITDWLPGIHSLGDSSSVEIEGEDLINQTKAKFVIEGGWGWHKLWPSCDSTLYSKTIDLLYRRPTRKVL